MEWMIRQLVYLSLIWPLLHKRTQGCSWRPSVSNSLNRGKSQCCNIFAFSLWRCMVCNVFWGVSQSTTRVIQDILFKFLVCDDDQLMVLMVMMVMMWAITNFDRKKYFDGAFTFQNLMKISFLTDNPLIQLFSSSISSPVCQQSNVIFEIENISLDQAVSVYERSRLLKKDVNSNS